MNFEYRSFPGQVYFGNEKLNLLPGLLKDYPKVMVIATSRMREEVESMSYALGKERVGWFSKVSQHVPENLVKEATEFRNAHQPGILVAIGGGSVIGLSKALALDEWCPQVVVPTTFAGSEQTNIYGISSGGVKRTGRDDKVLPAIVIYDPSLYSSMPKKLAVTSAMNAMAHLMEALYSTTTNPITSNNAIQGMDAIKAGIKALSYNSILDRDNIEKLLFGSFLAGKCLNEAEMGLHHRAAHVLGGSFGMDHSSVHTVLQPYVLDYQWPYIPPSIQADFKRILDSVYPPMALKVLAGNAGANTDLKSIGFMEKDIEKAVEIILSKPYPNIAPITKDGIKNMLTNAYLGKID